MKIAVAGTGYVGLSIATLLAQHNEVVAVDVIPEKVEKINRKESPIQDDLIEHYLAEKELQLMATLDEVLAIQEEGHAKRVEAEAALAKIENELREKLLSMTKTGQNSGLVEEVKA